jgi:hypothetical protein
MNIASQFKRMEFENIYRWAYVSDGMKHMTRRKLLYILLFWTTLVQIHVEV